MNERLTANCITNAPGGNPPCNNPAGVASLGFSTNSSHSGWTIGYRAEFDLGKNWSAKAEYDYIDFGGKTKVRRTER
jgi:opacity protein-like surface antigen